MGKNRLAVAIPNVLAVAIERAFSLIIRIERSIVCKSTVWSIHELQKCLRVFAELRLVEILVPFDEVIDACMKTSIANGIEIGHVVDEFALFIMDEDSVLDDSDRAHRLIHIVDR